MTPNTSHGVEAMSKREEAIEAMARALFAQSENEGLEMPTFSADDATAAYWFSQGPDAHGEDFHCWTICQEFRRAATAAYDAAIKVLMEPDEAMMEAGVIAMHQGAAYDDATHAAFQAMLKAASA